MENYIENYAVEDTEPAMFFVSPPKHVGGYRIGNHKSNYIQFNLVNKPNWLHRQFMRICLGWYWFDEIKPQ